MSENFSWRCWNKSWIFFWNFIKRNWFYGHLNLEPESSWSQRLGHIFFSKINRAVLNDFQAGFKSENFTLESEKSSYETEVPISITVPSRGATRSHSPNFMGLGIGSQKFKGSQSFKAVFEILAIWPRAGLGSQNSSGPGQLGQKILPGRADSQRNKFDVKWPPNNWKTP